MILQNNQNISKFRLKEANKKIMQNIQPLISTGAVESFLSCDVFTYAVNTQLFDQLMPSHSYWELTHFQ